MGATVKARPLLLDLFCGAGGAAVGYHQAGFDVIGVDVAWKRDYPFDFIQADVFDVLRSPGDYLPSVDVVHASPPCQAFTRARVTRLEDRAHPDLITPLRPLLLASGLPFVIENVDHAPLVDPVRVCMAQVLRADGFELRRHRWFETNWTAWPLGCGCGELPAAPVFGHGPGRDFYKVHGRGFTVDAMRRIMGVPWMRSRDDIVEAIPPAFAAYIGEQLIELLARRVAI